MLVCHPYSSVPIEVRRRHSDGSRYLLIHHSVFIPMIRSSPQLGSCTTGICFSSLGWEEQPQGVKYSEVETPHIIV